MADYIVTRKSDGVEVLRYSAAQAQEVNGFDLVDYEHKEWNPEAPPPSRGPRRLTKIQFRDRFTGQEKVGIEFSSIDNPTAPIEDRLRAAQLRVFLDDVASATAEADGTSIDLDDPRTIAGVQALEDFGLIAEGRANEVLND